MRKVRGWCLGSLVLVVALFAGAVPARATCLHCGMYGGCDPGGAYAICSSGKLLNVPYCVVFLPCTGDPTSGGGTDDPPPMRPRPSGTSLVPGGSTASRPVGHAGAAQDAGMLTLYALRMPLVGGFDPFGAHATSWVERGMPSTTTAAAMLAAVARRAHVADRDVPVCEESTSLGPGGYWASLAAEDGDGYALHAETAPGGTRVRVCALSGRAPSGRLADVTLADGELMCVRIRGGGHDYALALVPRRTGIEAWEATEGARQERALFDLEAGPLTARAQDDGVRFMMVDASPSGCP